jgi:hypothetical protein
LNMLRQMRLKSWKVRRATPAVERTLRFDRVLGRDCSIL